MLDALVSGTTGVHLTAWHLRGPGGIGRLPRR